MAENSKIAWTDHTWNPWQGCHKVSDGCKNCYMFRDKKRYGQDASTVIRSKDVTFNKPLHWKEPAKVFVCSWSDFFIEEADEWRTSAYAIMSKTAHLTYLLLTKRPENIAERWFYLQSRMKNVWLGVTAENQEQADKRIPILIKTPTVGKRFLSIEPMLSSIDLNQAYGDVWCRPELDWVIVGAESGPNRRPCNVEWVRQIITQCRNVGVPVFVKQLSINGKISDNMEDWQEDLRIREFPK